jgi:hypothetical protein
MFIVCVRGHHIIEFGIRPIDATSSDQRPSPRCGDSLSVGAFGAFRTGAWIGDSSGRQEGPARDANRTRSIRFAPPRR